LLSSKVFAHGERLANKTRAGIAASLLAVFRTQFQGDAKHRIAFSVMRGA
jgi:hypothetical protein